MTRHPAEYVFGTDGADIYVKGPTGDAISLVKQRGTPTLTTFEEVLDSYTNFKGQDVVDFRRPSKYLELDAERMSGLPTIRGTRVDLMTVLDEVDPDDPESIEEFAEDHVGVSTDAVRDALDFDMRVKAAG